MLENQDHCDFHEGIQQARAFLEDHDITRCLTSLSVLEKRYVEAAQVFDLIGQAFLVAGKVHEGTRYKTLHAVLTGIFRSVLETEHSTGRFSLTEKLDLRDDSEAIDQSDGLLPVTFAMGLEFMRQGHYGHALQVFEQLLKKEPENSDLRDIRNMAEIKYKKNKLRDILERMVRNVERMKSHTSIS